PRLHSFPTRRSSDLDAAVDVLVGPVITIDELHQVAAWPGPVDPDDLVVEGRVDGDHGRDPVDRKRHRLARTKCADGRVARKWVQDRKSTRLNSSHSQ